MKSYLRLRCNLSIGLEDELPQLVSPLPTLGIEIEETGGAVVGAAIYADSTEADALVRLAGILSDHGATDLQIDRIQKEDWLQGYRDAVRPFAVGNHWWIDPHPDVPTVAPDDRQRLVIEPRMAFGSGSHESTALMLMALEELEVAGVAVLDVGTGSGILALAAENLGALRVVALDIDETAIWVARQIRAQQEWSSRVDFVLGPVTCIGATQFQVVLCNMIFPNLRPLLQEMSRVLSADGLIIVAGLLAAEIDAVSSALSSVGLETRSSRVLGEWASLSATTVVR